MKKIIIFMLGLYFVSFVALYAQDEDKNNNNNAKKYTEKEFLDAVEKETKNRLKKYSPSNMVKLSQEMMSKERTLELRELELKKKAESIRASESDLTKKISRFKSQSENLLGCLEENENDQRKRVAHMVQVVSGMRPKNAAEVLSVQDVEIAVKILGSLKPERVSKIFNSMDKEISARLQKQYMNMKK